jgi:hypothetical protein
MVAESFYCILVAVLNLVAKAMEEEEKKVRAACSVFVLTRETQ